MYSVNIRAAHPQRPDRRLPPPFDVDGHYIAECRDKAITLERDPSRCQACPT